MSLGGSGFKSRFVPSRTRAEYSAAQEAEHQRENDAIAFGIARAKHRNCGDDCVLVPFPTFDEFRRIRKGLEI